MPGPGAAPYLPVELIPKIGADRQAGIDLEIRYMSGPLSAREVVEKNSDFAGLALAALGGISLKHNNLRSVVTLTQAPAYTLLVRTELKKKVRNIKDLNGLSIGINSGSKAGKSTGHQLVEYLLIRNGVDLDHVNFVPTGSNEKDYSVAILSGSIDAMMVQEPFASDLVEQGLAYRLIDLHDPKESRRWMGGPYLFTLLATRQDVIAAEPEKVRRLVKAVQLALRWISTHRAEEIAAAMALPADKQAQLTRFLKTNKAIYQPTGAFSAEQIQTTQRFFDIVEGPGITPAQVQLDNLVDAHWAGRTR